MVPYVYPNDYVIVRNLPHYKKGDVIVFTSDYYGNIIKRIKSINKSTFFIMSDNTHTYSSLFSIPHSTSKICGKVVLKFPLSKFKIRLY